MNKEVLHIGVIGLGFMGQVHLENYAKMEGVQIQGVADLIEDKVDRLATQHRCQGFKSAEELIADRAINVVDICTPTPTHRDLALLAAQNRKHIICEKPIARQITEAQEMVQTAKEQGVKLLIGHVVRFFPEYIKLRELVLAGEIGTPGIVRTFRGGASPIPQASWYGNPEESGGLIVDMLIHDFDWLRWTFGEVEHVYARGLSLQPLKEGQDLALVILRFKSGLLAHVEGSWSYPSTFPFTTRVEIAGNKGLLHYDSQESAPLHIFREAIGEGIGIRAPESPLAKNPYFSELKYFIKCIQRHEFPIIGAQDAIEALRIALAALKSLETNQTVRVGDIQ